MKACGLIVEYNPFHNGHVYHLEASKKKTNSDCVVAVMSGNFLQRGEPAIIDKWHRVNAALQTGVDLVVELPYVFAVQHADLFAKGAVLTLDALNVDTVCFGSEQGDIEPFMNAYEQFINNQQLFRTHLKANLDQGLSFPEASKIAYRMINLNTESLDLTKPNNILGFSYVKAIYDEQTSIQPETIQRTKSGYHDEVIKHEIASATSIRKEIFSQNQLGPNVKKAIPETTLQALKAYLSGTGIYHHWEHYFTLLQHIVFTQDERSIANIQGVSEGLEYKLKKTAKQATSFVHWMELLKSKRYTWTRLQRMFVHLLTNTTKEDLQSIHTIEKVPYIRILGMNEVGRAFVNSQKKEVEVPLLTQLQSFNHPYLSIEERAINSYYLAINPKYREYVKNRDIEPPIIYPQMKE